MIMVMIAEKSNEAKILKRDLRHAEPLGVCDSAEIQHTHKVGGDTSDN